jgi:hypothetical protein
MQFFLPSLLIFLVAMLVTAFLAPRITPWIAAILALAFLIYGIHDHQRMFAYEYKQSTWQQGLKIYAPFLVIGGILLFCMYAMVAFFTGGTVPVPAMPSLSLSSSPVDSLSSNFSSLNNSLSRAANSVMNQTSNLIQSVNRSMNRPSGVSLAEVI